MYRTFGRARFAGAFLAVAVLLLAACTAPSPTPAKPTEAPKPAAPPAAPAAVPSPASAAAAPSPSPSVNPITTTSDVVPPPANAAIKITVPAANASVPAGDVRVAYDLTNVTTVPAAEARKVDDLHLHVLLDVDPAPYLGTTTFIPLGNPSIVHTAAKEVTFKDVKAGAHKITVILTGANHISTKPPTSDTVTFTVQ